MYFNHLAGKHKICIQDTECSLEIQYPAIIYTFTIFSLCLNNSKGIFYYMLISRNSKIYINLMFNKEQFVQGNQFQLHGNKSTYIYISRRNKRCNYVSYITILIGNQRRQNYI